METNFEFLFSHYSTLFDYKLGLLNHFYQYFASFSHFLQLLITFFDFLHSLTLYALHLTLYAYESERPV